MHPCWTLVNKKKYVLIDYPFSCQYTEKVNKILCNISKRKNKSLLWGYQAASVDCCYHTGLYSCVTGALSPSNRWPLIRLHVIWVSPNPTNSFLVQTHTFTYKTIFPFIDVLLCMTVKANWLQRKGTSK